MPDEVWDRIRSQAEEEAGREPVLRPFLEASVLAPAGLEEALAGLVASKIACSSLSQEATRAVLVETLTGDADVSAALRADLVAIVARNPACSSELEPFLHFKGYHGLALHRAAHRLWAADRHGLALLLQSRMSEAFGIDIHPAARFGRGIFIDHATSVVVGETAVVEDDVSMLHEVTLGGTGKESGDRHPKIRHGVLLCAGAKILGNVEVGEGAKVGAGSVVLDDVPPHTTVAGVPARVVGRARTELPALDMDQSLPLDYSI